MKQILAVLLCVLMLCTGCAGNNGQSEESLYSSITMEDAAVLLESENDYLILDVRTEQEYFSGHIPGAMCIPNEDIDETVVEILTDKEQVIFVYCRSGNRSKQAAEKLANLGYTNIVEIGGVKDWPGDLVIIGEK
ncbi:MAG: rhodanese-like domain-containing protein [Peptococcaceae bacterium]|nr:rhodanese-like domain-containing protein [Peptococcaceae bacterium]